MKMIVTTKLFGTLEIEESKIIHFEHGLIGFEFLNKFAILYKEKEEEKHTVCWLQSLDEPELAFPIVDPFLIKEDYNPEINDDNLQTLGNINEENLSVMVTLTVPEDVTKMSCNLKAPIIMNAEQKKGAQIIAENAEYPVKFYIYDILKARKNSKEEC